MVREGYRIASDRVEPTTVNTGGVSIESNGLCPTVIGDDNSTFGTLEPPSLTLIPGVSAAMLSPGRISALNPRQFHSQNILPGSYLLHPVNMQSSLQLLPSNLSTSQLDIAAQVSPEQPQWVQVLNKRAHIQFQMMQRERQQEQLLHRMTMMGGLGAAMGGLGMMQLGGGIQGLGDTGIGSSHNIMGLGGTMDVPMLQRGQTPSIGNLGQFSSFGNNVSSLNERIQPFGMMSDHVAALLPKLRAAEAQGRALMSGIPIHRNAGAMQMQGPFIPDMAYLLKRQQLSQSQIHQQLQIRSSQQMQQDMRLLHQHADAASLAKQAGSPLSQVSQQQSDHLPQMSPLQLSTKLRLQEQGKPRAEHRDS